MGVIWGIPYLLIKVADGGVSVPVLVGTRVALGLALLLPAAISAGTSARSRGTCGGWPRNNYCRMLTHL